MYQYVHLLLLNRPSTAASVTQPSPVQTPTSQAGPSSADRKDTLEKEKRFVCIFSATLIIQYHFQDLPENWSIRKKEESVKLLLSSSHAQKRFFGYRTHRAFTQ